MFGVQTYHNTAKPGERNCLRYAGSVVNSLNHQGHVGKTLAGRTGRDALAGWSGSTGDPCRARMMQFGTRGESRAGNRNLITDNQ
jgi:hypothetical protein